MPERSTTNTLSSGAGSSTTTTTTTTTTSVAVVLSKSDSATTSADPFYSQRVQVVLWACEQQSRGGGGGGGSGDISQLDSGSSVLDGGSRRRRCLLKYYQFWDHPKQFSHLDTLLLRLSPVKVVHVGTTESLFANNEGGSGGTNSKNNSGDTPKTAAKNKNRMSIVLERLMNFLQERIGEWHSSGMIFPSSIDNDANDEQSSGGSSSPGGTSSSGGGRGGSTAYLAAAKESALRLHESIPNLDVSRLESLLPQLLVHDGNSNNNEVVAADNDDDETMMDVDGMSTTTGGSSSSVNHNHLLRQSIVRVAGDVELHNPQVARGLVFWLYTAGLWTTGTSILDDIAHKHVYDLQAGRLDSHLYLDRTAADAIHLWPPSGLGQETYTGGSRSNNSIAGLLGEPLQTVSGRRMLETWLRQPLIDLQALVERQDAVQLLVDRAVERDALHSQALRLFSGKGRDLTLLAMQLGEYAAGDDDDNDGNAAAGSSPPPLVKSTRKALNTLYELYLVSSQKIPSLVESLCTLLQPTEENDLVAGGESVTSSTLLDALAEKLNECSKYLERSADLVESLMDLDAAPRDLLLKPTFKPELGEISKELEELDAQLREVHNDMNAEWEGLTGKANAVRLEKLNSNKSGSIDNDNNDDGCNGEEVQWQFRLADTNDSKTLQQQLAGTVRVHKLLKNGVYFSTKELRELATQRQSLMHEYNRLSREVLSNAIVVAATYQHVLEDAGQALATLDVLVALAHVAAHHPSGYCRPTLTDSVDPGVGVDLRQARHPCVELQENTDYIPNDIRLVFGESSFLLVTGPNMGGKSTYIRALGAIVTMAQIGSFVPCSSATVNICHHILARVGAGDLQERGISTFMAEMLESSSILRTATKRSLIIIDELGRGTSTFDGYGLARAISEYIVQNIGCMTVFATHFHELTALEETESSVKNCHVTAQKGSQGLIFLYEIRAGPCLESFGVQVAETANFPSSVIADARRNASELERFQYSKRRSQKITTDQQAGVDSMDAQIEGDDDDAEAESTSMADVAITDQFKRLSRDAVCQTFTSDEEKRRALLRSLGVM